LSAIPFIINSLYATIARIQRRMSAVVTLALISCALILGLSHVLLRVYGITGVGLTWLVSQTLIAAVLLWTPELRTLWSSRRGETVIGEAPAQVPEGTTPSWDYRVEPPSDAKDPVTWSTSRRVWL